MVKRLAHQRLAGRVQRRGGLIQNEQVRPTDERLRQGEPLLHAARELAGIAFFGRQIEPAQQLQRARSQRTAIYTAVQACGQQHRLKRRTGKEDGSIRHVANACPSRARLGKRRAQQLTAAAAWLQQAHRNVDRG